MPVIDIWFIIIDSEASDLLKLKSARTFHATLPVVPRKGEQVVKYTGELGVEYTVMEVSYLIGAPNEFYTTYGMKSPVCVYIVKNSDMNKE